MTERGKRAAKVRDARRTDQAPERHGNRKSTKKWCRGIYGRKHKPECRSYREHKRASFAPHEWLLLVCADCGKELESYTPVRWFRRDAPDWAKIKGA